MALPKYFKRNAQAAAALVQGFDANALASKLESEVIGVFYDATSVSSTEEQAALDLCVRLLSRLYPKLAIVAIEGAKKAVGKRLRALAREINPEIEFSERLEDVTRLLIFGQTRMKLPKALAKSAWYLGSDGWIAKVSRTAPMGSGKSSNPFGAGAAACVATSNVFRAVFSQELGGDHLDEELALSVLELLPASAATSNPDFGEVLLDDVHLVGVGAIGNGVLWALSRMKCVGTIHLVDHEALSESNLQRYVMTNAADLGASKAELAVKLLAPQAHDLNAVAHPAEWASYAETVVEHRFETVLSAVDSAKARIEIQASLPKVVYNAWTQRGEAGLSRHHFLGEMACLACLYLPAGTADNEDALIARALRLGDDQAILREVRQRLQQTLPTDRGFLERVAAGAGIDYASIASFEGRPLRELYVDGVCGGRIMEFHQAAIQAKAEVPMGFQSAFAGLLLAAELVRPCPIRETITQIDLLDTFPERPSRFRAKTSKPACLCLDDDFIEVFKAKYTG